jgi:hypothetical protein
MLKPSDQTGQMPQPPDERPFGEMVGELVENGKAYARAEVDLAKAMALAKVNAVKVPAIMFGAAFVMILTAVNVLGVGALLALAPLIGPALAGLIVFLALAGIAGGLAWYGVTRLREDL